MIIHKGAHRGEHSVVYDGPAAGGGQGGVGQRVGAEGMVEDSGASVPPV